MREADEQVGSSPSSGHIAVPDLFDRVCGAVPVDLSWIARPSFHLCRQSCLERDAAARENTHAMLQHTLVTFNSVRGLYML